MLKRIGAAVISAALLASPLSCRRESLRIGPIMLDKSPEAVAAREEDARRTRCAILFHRIQKLYREGESLRGQRRLGPAEDKYERALLTIASIRDTCPGWNTSSLDRLEGICSRAKRAVDREFKERTARAAEALKRFAVEQAAAPDSPAPFIELGRFYFDEGDYMNAMRQFQAALMKDPRSLEAMIEVARVYTRTGYISDAKEYYKKIIEIYPGIPVIHYNLGGIYFKEGLPTYAVREFKKALELQPAYPEAHNALGLVYKQLGQYDIALRHFHSALALSPDDPHILYNIGLAYLAKNNHQTGLNYLYRARDIFGPDSPMGRSITDRISRCHRFR